MLPGPRYDISRLTSARYRQAWIGCGMLALLSGLIVGSIAVNYRHLGQQLAASSGFVSLVSTLAFTELVVTGVLLTTLAVIWSWTRRGPTVITVSDVGISFEYPSGKRVDLEWDDAGARLDLYDCLRSRDPLGPPVEGGIFLFSPATGPNSLIPLTSAAFLGIQEAASRHLRSARIQVSPWNIGGYPTRTIHMRYTSKRTSDW